MPSPSHVGMSSSHTELTDEEIRDLLGGVLDEQHQNHHFDEEHQQHHHVSYRNESMDNGDIDSTLGSSGVVGMNSATGNGNEYGSDRATEVSSEAKALARTERKRSREKQRRSDVNKQLAELTSALRKIESEDPEETKHLPAYSPSNRVDLICRTIQLLNSLYENNKKRKASIVDLEKQLEVAKKAGEEAAAKLKESMMAPQTIGNNKVMMMVPMMIDNGSAAPMPMMAPFMGAMPSVATPAPGPADASVPSMSTAASMPMMMPPMPWMMPPVTAALPNHMQVPSAPMPSASAHGSTASSATATPAEASSTSLSVATSKPDSKQQGSASKMGSNLAHCA